MATAAAPTVARGPPCPLLKFRDGAPHLAQEGLELIEQLSAPLRVVVFVGDGRSGKSHLASEALLGVGCDDTAAFESGSSAKPVTRGIDVAAFDHNGGHVLVLDCEGGNNALGEIRSLVNVIGTLVGTLVVFVTSAMVSEGALQSLGASIAARELVRCDEGANLQEQQLLLVVNMTRLEFEEGHLEEMLAESHGDAGRSELRQAVAAAFPRRRLLAVPPVGLVGYVETLKQVRCSALSSAAPLSVGGAELSGREARRLLERAFVEVAATKQVNLPSMHRYVIFDGFLSPLVKRLTRELKAQLPELSDYDAGLAQRDPRGRAISTFDEECRRLTHKEMVKEARAQLSTRVEELWVPLARLNEAFGMEVRETSVETRAVHLLTCVEQIGCGATAASICKTTHKIQSRVRTVRKRSDEPEFSEWEDTGKETTSVETNAPKSVVSGQVATGALPADLQGHLCKRTRPVVSSRVLCVGGVACAGPVDGLTRSHSRFFVLTRMHLLWWKTKASFLRGETCTSCINLLVHVARLEFDEDLHVFSLHPRDGRWERPTTFEGGVDRVFFFDCRGSEHGFERWRASLEAHLEHAQKVTDTLGKQWIRDNVRVERVTLQPGHSLMDGGPVQPQKVWVARCGGA